MDSETGKPAAGRAAGIRRRYADSSADHLWRRLNAIDFVNRGMLAAAVLLLSFIPFVIVAEALAGRSAISTMVRRFGLDPAAARAVGTVFASPRETTSSITGLSWVFLVLSGLASAAAIQELYEHVFEVKNRGFVRETPRRIVWIVALIATMAVVGLVQPWLHSVGGVVLVGISALGGATIFWWFSMWLLLAGRRGWRELLPAALATGVCWFGMTVMFRLTMSSTITSNYRTYGAIGVVFALMSFLVAVSVVLILGAIFGVVWRERHQRNDP